MTNTLLDRYKNNIVFSTVVGSNAYGLATETSDVDTRGWFFVPTEELLTLEKTPEVIEDKVNDTTYWELSHFLAQLVKNNPNALEVLWANDPSYLSSDAIINGYARQLVANRKRFVSKRVTKTYGGYSTREKQKGYEMLNRGNENGWKHLMHLIRLMLSVNHLLASGDLMIDVGEYRNDLLSVRNGEVDEQYVDTWYFNLNAEFNYLKENNDLPEEPDTKWVNEFLVSFRKSVMK